MRRLAERIDGTPRPEPAPVAAPPAPAKPAAPARPVERHGTFKAGLEIAGKGYSLRPAKAGPPIEGVVTLRKLEGPEPTAYAIATDGLEIHCTCPDHDINGFACKHIMSIVKLARILKPFADAAEGGAL